MKIGDKIIIILVILGALASYFYFHLQAAPAEEMVARIEVNNRLYKRINLKDVEEPYQIKISQEGGRYNIIRVEQGRIRMSDANCPNKLGVQVGWLSRPGEMAVCLPHRVVITIEAGEREPEVDGVAY